MARILVTGGAGFIASHVVDAYVAEGHEVAVLDNLSTGKREYLNPKVKFYEIDILDKNALPAVFDEFQPEVINHHAAHIQVGYSVQNPQFDAAVNILGLLNLMELAHKKGTVKQVIMASTGGAMYGNKPVPFTEDMNAQPLSPYGVSKRAGELYLNYYYELYGIRYAVLRYSNVYGPRQNPHGESGVVSIFMEKILKGETPVINGEGNNTRDYVFVSDVAKANLLVLGTDKVGEWNVGTTTEISANEVFAKVKEAMHSDVAEQHGPARPGEQTRSSLNYGKIQHDFGWQPTVSFDEGVQRTAAFFLEKQAPSASL